MESTTGNTTLEIVNAALANPECPMTHRGRTLAEMGYYSNPCLMSQGSFRLVIFAYDDQTLSVEAYDEISVEGFEATGIPNSGSTKLKHLLAGFEHKKNKLAKLVVVENTLKLVVGKCACRTGSSSGFGKISALYLMAPLDAGETLRVAKRYETEKRLRAEAREAAMDSFREALSRMEAVLSGSAPAQAPTQEPAPAPAPASAPAPAPAPAQRPAQAPGQGGRTIRVNVGAGDGSLLGALLGGGRPRSPGAAGQGPAGGQ